MNWEAAGVVLGGGIAICGYMTWYVKTTVRAIVAAENDKLLARINGTYKRTAEFAVRDAEIERRLAKAEDHIEALPAVLTMQKRAKA